MTPRAVAATSCEPRPGRPLRARGMDAPAQPHGCGTLRRTGRRNTLPPPAGEAGTLRRAPWGLPARMPRATTAGPPDGSGGPATFPASRRSRREPPGFGWNPYRRTPIFDCKPGPSRRRPTDAAMPTDLLQLARERVLILDGAMGTSLHRYKPTDKDWGYAPNGKSLLNLSDALVYTHPEWIREIHRGFFAAGCDGDRDEHVQRARRSSSTSSAWATSSTRSTGSTSASRRRSPPSSPPRTGRGSSIGSVGPGTKMPSLTDPAIYADFDTPRRRLPPAAPDHDRGAGRRHPDRDVLRHPPGEVRGHHRHRGDEAGRRPAAADGATHDHRRAARRCCPGTDIPAALVGPRPARRDRRDRDELRRRPGPDARRHPPPEPAQPTSCSACCRTPACPRRAATRRTSRSSPNGLADWLERFVTEFGVNIVGGCCGTTHGPPEGGRRPRRRQEAGDADADVPAGGVEPADRSQELIVDQKPLLVGERTNTNGSRKFKQLLEKEDWHGLVEMAQEQEREGVHVLDVCVDYVGRDGVRDMKEVDQAVQRGADQAAHARQHRGAGHRGRAEAVQRQDDHQLDQPGGRPQDARPEDDARQEVRGRPRRADHRREGPGRHRRVEVRGRRSGSTTSSSTSTASRRRT